VSAPSYNFVAQHGKAIDDAVRASTLIVLKVKKTILANYG
jgi:hypothetical protein